MHTYPVLALIEKHGTAISVVAGLAPLAAAIYGVIAHEFPAVPTLAAALLIAGFVFVMVKGFSELVAIVLDMLVPR